MSKSRATDFSDPDKIVGYEVEVYFHAASGKPQVVKHWLGSLATCKRKARMLRHYRGTWETRPVTAAAWIRAYGHGRM